MYLVHAVGLAFPFSFPPLVVVVHRAQISNVPPPPHPHLLPLLLPILLGQQLRVGTTCKEGGDVIVFKSLVEEVDKPEDVPSSSSFDRSTQPKPPILLCLPAPSNRPFPAAPPSAAAGG